jgi:hypothetical protein
MDGFRLSDSALSFIARLTFFKEFMVYNMYALASTIFGRVHPGGLKNTKSLLLASFVALSSPS